MYQFELRPFRTNQLKHAFELEKEVEKIFDGFSKNHAFTPSSEILEDEKIFLVSLDVPGIKKDEIVIEVKDNVLLISGERKEGERSEHFNVLRSERRYGKFSRSFTIPQNVNAEAIQARFENGVLEIALPK